MLEIQGDRLDWKWICTDGQIRDHFTMLKNTRQRRHLTVKQGDAVTLTAPFAGKWNKSGSTGSTLEVRPERTTLYTVKDPAGCAQETFEVEVTK
jgi:hypothetical protein